MLEVADEGKERNIQPQRWGERKTDEMTGATLGALATYSDSAWISIFRW